MDDGIDSYIGIGSNMGDRQAFCREALRLIAGFPQSALVTASSLYETEPQDLAGQDWFINCVASIRTRLSPAALLRACQEVEHTLGRKRSAPCGPRTIDLDILFYGDAIVAEPGLSIPHPRAQARRFVLEPLREIAPDLKHPALNKTAAELLRELRGQEARRVAALDPAQFLKPRAG
ncbi:MAG TPA: 2-amino-4-hydroxy-6-hydroxymethyldihydropteridine diphosphokinase [Nitrospiria bacterium]